MAVRSRSLRWLQILAVCNFLGTVNSPPQKHQRYQKNAILGGSASLFLNITPGEMVSKSRLDFQPISGEGCELAVFMDGQWKRSKSTDRFGQRLEMANETLVRITRLKMEDSGLFKASVRLPSAKIQYHFFSLTVYAPVPEPQILLQEALSTSDRCNVTLWCQVLGKEGFNVSWKRGRHLTTLEGSLNWYQLSENSSKLQLSWHPKLSDSSVTCLVSNTVDQKNASFDLLKICQNDALQKERSLIGRKSQPSNEPYVLIVLICLAILGCSVYAVSVYCISRSETKMVKRKEGCGNLSILASERHLKKRLLHFDESDQES